jgi:uncharacterized protein YutE (UPF0331/DUF86 family)
MQPDNISLNKAGIIERCIRRMREEYTADPKLGNYTHLDALILNIERACQAAIDLAMHIVAGDHLGIPQSSAEAFTLLSKAGKLDADLARRLSRMTGFRNVAIHQYQDIDPDIIHHIMQDGWKDLTVFCTTIGLEISP